MKSGRIEQYAHLSEFSSVREFNESITRLLQVHGHHFTKGERIAFNHLTRFCVKVIGICNARICKLVKACQSTKGGISRSTFERMLRKAKSLGILSIYRTLRDSGGYSHSVYIFHRFDLSNNEQLNHREKASTPDGSRVEEQHCATETIIYKTKNLHNKNLRKQPLLHTHLQELDETFVPTYVPHAFVKAIKPFFNRATEICKLWNLAQSAYRCARFQPDQPIEQKLATIVKAFKLTVYQYKKRRIKTTFNQYYYGTLAQLFTYEKRVVHAEKTNWGLWLESQQLK